MNRSKNVITNTLIHSQNYSLEDVLQDIFLKNLETPVLEYLFNKIPL